MPIARTPWPHGFPEVIVHTTVAMRDAHPDYTSAKAGARDAAFRLVSALLSDTAVAKIRDVLGALRPIIIPVRAVETTGINLIPDAMGHDLARRLSFPVATVPTDIVQTNTVGHTRASGFHRLVFQPTFEGPVETGQPYLLVDDHVGLGGTLANLRGHIERAGGQVVLVTTLCASRRSEVLALRPETLHALLEKHGAALEEYWREHFGFGLDALTEAEAGYLLRTPSVDAVRDRMAEAGGQGVQGAVRSDQGGSPPRPRRGRP
jgi:hypothetical protein